MPASDQVPQEQAALLCKGPSPYEKKTYDSWPRPIRSFVAAWVSPVMEGQAKQEPRRGSVHLGSGCGLAVPAAVLDPLGSAHAQTS